MLHRKLSHSHLSGFSTVLKRYVSNVCILAGTPTLDAQGARLMHSIRESSTEEVNFFGIGGQEMINAGLDDVIGDINKFNTYPFYPLKNMRSYSEYFFFHPQMAYTRYCNKQVYDKVQNRYTDNKDASLTHSKTRGFKARPLHFSRKPSSR